MSNFESGGTAMNTTIDPFLTDQPTTGLHPINTGHLVMGLVFAGLVGIWALIAGDVVANDDIRWLLPIPWVAGGGIGLAAATYANVRSRRTASPAGHPASAPKSTWSSEATESLTTDDTEPTEEIR